MKYFIFFLSIIFLCACTTNRYAATNRVYKKQARVLAKNISRPPVGYDKATWIGTTNFGLRKPSMVIIHHTAQNSCEQTFKTFTLARTQVSAHYVICKDGTIHHMLNDYLRAWHAGIGSWGNDQDINSSSIGIELDNDGFEPFTTVQINSLLSLLDTLKKNYNIPKANFIGHADIAPSRKNDPNKYFPWNLLSQKGFGLWYGDTTNVSVPGNFNAIQALRIIGYSVRDTLATIKAFKRHFISNDSTLNLNEGERKILFDLEKKYE